jgi:heme-degrading monooxygenase HmoA
MYARMVSLYIKPNKIDEMATFFQDKLLQIITDQPGFKGMFVLKRPEENKEVCITLWEKLVDLEAFNISYSILKNEIVPFLTKIPKVEIFQVVVPEEARPAGVFAFSESSLGIHIINPFEAELSVMEALAVES